MAYYKMCSKSDVYAYCDAIAPDIGGKKEKENRSMENIEHLMTVLEQCPFIMPALGCNYKDAAKHLASAGVFLLPVQVGDTVYGVFANYGEEVHKCEVVKSRVVQFKAGTIRCFLDVEFDIEDPFYHDGRLMRCGAQAVFGSDFGEWRRAYLTREEAEAANKGA